MKNAHYALLIIGVLLCSCRKEQGEASEKKDHDIPYLATRDVQWKFHFVGERGHDPDDPYYVDTSYHTYSTAEPIGDDTVVNGNRRHWYKIVNKHYQNETLLRVDSTKRHIEEDTVQKRLSVVNYGTELFKTVDYSDNTGMAYFDEKRGWLNEFEDGVIEIDGIAITRSAVIIPGVGKRFYKAKSIGGPYGPFSYFVQGNIAPWGSHIVSMDFVYKGRVYHFDF